jgi:hypothetical protein
MVSDIIGNRYGSSHNWVAETPQDNSKRTLYNCQDCNRFFCHCYDRQPDIFIAMKEENMPDQCAAK